VTAPDATLTGRLRGALRFAIWGDTPGDIPTDEAAHLADVAAQTVAAWLREQRETVGAAICGARATGEWGSCLPDAEGAAADAALAALVAAIGGAE
jgi:hypothetical protein